MFEGELTRIEELLRALTYTRCVIFGAAAALAVAWTAAPGHARAAGAARAAAPQTPTLLATAPLDATGFVARPGFMIFQQNRPNWTADYLAGPNLTQQGFQAGRQPPIVWTHWGSRAVGRASYWIGYHTSCTRCRYTSRAVSLAAWRVVDGRYTRLSITDLAGSKGSTYDLASVTVPTDGVAGGVPAYAWCNERYSRSCSPP
jgi:hypothetical protein